MDKSVQIDTFNRFIRVSRETIISLNKYEDMLIKANNKLSKKKEMTLKVTLLLKDLIYQNQYLLVQHRDCSCSNYESQSDLS